MVWKSSSEFGAELKERRLDPREPWDKLPAKLLRFFLHLLFHNVQHLFNEHLLHTETNMGKNSCPHSVAMLRRQTLEISYMGLEDIVQSVQCCPEFRFPALRIKESSWAQWHMLVVPALGDRARRIPGAS